MSWAVWITGLPGSGKSVIARALASDLHARGEHVVVLELDQIRRVITPTPTYSDAEREAVYRALVYMGAILVHAGIPVILDATGHRRAWRDLAREFIPNFAEVQLLCPLEVCHQREETRPRGSAPAGIYARGTRAGARVPGVNVEYEFARSPELTIDTTTHTVTEAAAAAVDLVCRHFLAAPRGSLKMPIFDETGLRRRLLLEEGSPEQKEISQRACTHAAQLLSGARAAKPRTAHQRRRLA